MVQEDLKIYFCLGLLERDIVIQSNAPNTPLTQALSPLSFLDPETETNLYIIDAIFSRRSRGMDLKYC